MAVAATLVTDTPIVANIGVHSRNGGCVAGGKPRSGPKTRRSGPTAAILVLKTAYSLA